MVKQILFRGRDKDSHDWIYWNEFGQICYSDGTRRGECVVSEYAYRIDQDSISQFTGCYDQYGSKLFELDIVQTQPIYDRPYSKYQKGKNFYGVVEWEERNVGGQTYSTGWTVRTEELGRYGHYSWGIFFECEKVGDIYSLPDIASKLQQGSSGGTDS